MKTQQDQENASPVIQQKCNKQASAFKDERPETVAQGKLYDMVNRSQQVTQMQSLQRMVDNRVQNAPFDPIQRKENKTGLPDNLKTGVENLSGHSMDDVKVHYNSPKPAQLKAHAYAQGTDIHVASGQEKHLPHEAWHVVQQKQGRVKPTMQMKGKVNVNDDSGLEKEADVMGAKASLMFKAPRPIQLKNTAPLSTIQRKPLEKVKEHQTTFNPKNRITKSYRQKINGKIEEWNSLNEKTEGDEEKPGEEKRGEEKLFALKSLKALLLKKINKEKGTYRGVSRDLEDLAGLVHLEEHKAEKVESKNFIDGTKLLKSDDEIDSKRYDQKHAGDSRIGAVKDVLTHKRDFAVDLSSKTVDNNTTRIASLETKMTAPKEAGDVIGSSGGDIGKLQKHMITIVKDVQVNEGRIKAIDNPVQGDFGFNSYFFKIKSDADSESIYQRSKHLGINEQAKGILKTEYFDAVSTSTKIPGFGGSKVLNASKLSPYLKQSEDNSKQSSRRVREAVADKSIVELFYNQMESIKEKDKSGEETKSSLKEESEQIIKESVLMQKKQDKRFKAQSVLQDRLQKDGRIGALGDTILNAIKGAGAKGAIKLLTLGFKSYEIKVDNRGIKGKKNLSLDEEGNLKAEDVEGGFKGSLNPYKQLVSISTEWESIKGKMIDAGKGNEIATRFSNTADALGGLKTLMTRLSELTSSLLYLSIVIGLALPVILPTTVLFGLTCASILLWSSLLRAGLAALIASLNGLAQMRNNNPSLFNEMSSKTKSSGIEFLAEGASMGARVGFGTSDLGGVGSDSGKGIEDTLLGSNEKVEKAAYGNMIAMGASVHGGKEGLSLGTKLSSSIAADKGNESYKGGPVKAKEKVSPAKFKLIQKSYDTTRQKLGTNAESVYGVLFKFKPKEKLPQVAAEGVNEDQSEAIEGMHKVTNLSNEIGDFRAILEPGMQLPGVVNQS